MDRSKAFTLIELLVVIAIIALLMSILMPALSRVKEQTKAVICTSNLHQWSLAFKVHTDESGGSFPQSISWTEWMQEYVRADSTGGGLGVAAPGDPDEPYETKKMFFCPTATKTWAQGGQHPFVAWEYDGIDPLISGSYGLNLWVTQNTGGDRSGELLWKSPNVKGAMYVPMFMDCSMYSNVCPLPIDEPPDYDGHRSTGNTNEIRRVCINRHRMAINIAFLDFSVRKAGLKSLWTLHWHRNWDGTLPPVWPPWLQNAAAE